MRPIHSRKRRAKSPKSRVSRRSVQIRNLTDIIAFAVREATPEILLEEVKRLYERIVQKPGMVSWPTDPAQMPEIRGRIRSMHEELRRNLETMVRWVGEDPPEPWILPPIKRVITRINHDFESAYDAPFDNAFLNACADQLTLQEGRLVQVCREEGCERLFVRNRQGQYCAVHGDIHQRQARYREHLTSEEKRKRRRRYYMNYLKRHNPQHWKHLVKREEQSTVGS